MGVKVFLEYILESEDITTVTASVLYYLLENRKNEGLIGFSHQCSFILLLLSGERSFSIALNKPFKIKQWSYELDSKPSNFHDFLILIVYKLFTDSSASLLPLRECLLTIITNTSPYISSISSNASGKLIKLFLKFSAPKPLLTNEKYHRFCQFLLEIFNNLIQYQFAGTSFPFSLLSPLFFGPIFACNYLYVLTGKSINREPGCSVRDTP